ncbi:MAG: DUF5723 family protein [Bacteroidota bacterium]
MIKSVHTFFTFCLLCLSLGTNAQEMSLYFMPDLFQASKANPAFMTEQRTIYTLPSFYFNAHHTGASYNDLIRTDANGQNVLDLDPVIGDLKANNIVRIGFDFETASTSFGTKIWRASITHALRARAFISYPKSLVQLGWEGNEPFIGRNMNIGPDFQAMAYSELGLGFAMKLPKMTLGGRLKILSGLYDISSGRTLARVRTSEEYYQLQLSTFYQINTSSLVGSTSFDDYDPEFAFRILSKNWGLAVDLGGVVRVTDKITFSASIVDLGGIKWKSNPTNHTSQGAYSYEGLEIANILRDDEVDFEESLDTLKQIFDFQETNNAYYTALPARLYIGGTYKLNKHFTAGAVVHFEQFRQRTMAGLGVNTTVRLGRIFTAGMTYSVFSNTYDNLGFNTALQLGPVQIFFLSDNILATFRPYDSRNTNLRFGMNLAFK